MGVGRGCAGAWRWLIGSCVIMNLGSFQLQLERCHLALLRLPPPPTSLARSWRPSAGEARSKPTSPACLNAHRPPGPVKTLPGRTVLGAAPLGVWPAPFRLAPLPGQHPSEVGHGQGLKGEAG